MFSIYPVFFILCARSGKFHLCVGDIKEVIGPTFQMRKLNSKKRKCLLQGHTDRNVKCVWNTVSESKPALVLGPKGASRGTTCIEVPTGGSQTPDPELPCLQGACVHVRCFPSWQLVLTIPHRRQTPICGLPSPNVVGAGKLWIKNTIRVLGHLSCAFSEQLGLHCS